jgi:hypothetical protein
MPRFCGAGEMGDHAFSHPVDMSTKHDVGPLRLGDHPFTKVKPAIDRQPLVDQDSVEDILILVLQSSRVVPMPFNVCQRFRFHAARPPAIEIDQEYPTVKIARSLRKPEPAPVVVPVRAALMRDCGQNTLAQVDSIQIVNRSPNDRVPVQVKEPVD